MPRKVHPSTVNSCFLSTCLSIHLCCNSFSSIILIFIIWCLVHVCLLVGGVSFHFRVREGGGWCDWWLDTGGMCIMQ